MMLNPYRYLATSLRSQMRIEGEMSEADRKCTQWMVLVQFAGTSAQLILADVNTCILILGENGKRRFDYPNKILDTLDRLANQEFPLYEIRSDRKGRVARSFFRHKVRDCEPQHGESIVGISADSTEKVCFLARRSISGKLSWIAPKT
jgi:hypothetical protein